jgi:hypothetical protein
VASLAHSLSSLYTHLEQAFNYPFTSNLVELHMYTAEHLHMPIENPVALGIECSRQLHNTIYIMLHHTMASRRTWKQKSSVIQNLHVTILTLSAPDKMRPEKKEIYHNARNVSDLM